MFAAELVYWIILHVPCTGNTIVNVSAIYSIIAALYQDGITVTAPITPLGSAIHASDQPLYIGHRDAQNHADRFEGAIDTLRIYDRTLTHCSLHCYPCVDRLRVCKPQ